MNPRFLILLILFFTQGLLAQVSMKIKFPVEQVSTGELLKVEVVLDSASAQALPIQSLKGETIADYIYIQYFSPLIRREGSDNFTADAEIVLIRKPESNQVQTTFKGLPLFIGWDNVEIVAVDTPPDYVFETFTIPTPLNILRWILAAILVALASWGAWILLRKIRTKKNEKQRLKDLKSRLTSAKDYHGVVEIWKSKHSFLKDFPFLESSFSNLETVLFRFQFKPKRTMEEEFKVMDAYRTFVKESEGGLSGI